MIRRMIAGAVALALAGCGSWNPWAGPQEERVAPPADAVAFQCDGGRRLTVRMPANAKSVTVVLPERQFRLDDSPAASGVRYSNGRTTFHLKGEEAFLEEDGKMLFEGCKRMR